MKRFEVGKKYKNIIWDGFDYVQNGTVEILSRVPQTKRHPKGFVFEFYPAIINGKKTIVDIREDTKLGSETLHELASTGNWKRNTVRYGLEEA